MKEFPIIINNKKVISTDVYTFIKHGKPHDAVDYVISKTGCTENEAIEVIDELKDLVQQNIKATIEKQKRPLYESKTKVIDCTKEDIYIPKNIPKCPKCGSTAITAGQRGYSLLTGFIGSGKTVNRCANCGYKWESGK
ncbi:hypothetical protein [Frisingicoccus sp.]|uniref:hypothetical protein n=1 Tax=Frisingicoccus sp. TaxID=1918627 RepID=UPI003AB61895